MQLPMYNMRSNAGSAQQTQGPKYYAQPAQPHQDRNGPQPRLLHGVGGPGPSQGKCNATYEDSGPQGDFLPPGSPMESSIRQ
jgi:hypothetical protein